MVISTFLTFLILLCEYHFLHQDLLVCPENGYIDNRLKTLRSQQKIIRSKQNANDNKPNPNETVEVLDENISEKVEEIAEYLKSIVISSNNMEIFKSKLSQTMEYRSKILKNNNLSLRIHFPYFFADPSLVSYVIRAKKSLNLSLI